MSAEADAKTILDVVKFATEQESRAVNAERDLKVYQNELDTLAPAIQAAREFLASASNTATVTPAEVTDAEAILGLLAHAQRSRNDATARGADWSATPVYCGITDGRAEAVKDTRIAHSNWLHRSLYSGDPAAGPPPITFPNGMPAGLESPYDTPLENAAWIGRLCRDGGVIHNREKEPVPFVPGAPIVADWEEHYTDNLGRPLPAEKYGKLARLIRVIRENAAPGQTVAINALSSFGQPHTWEQMWRDGKGPTAEDERAIVAGMEPYRPILDAVDVVICDLSVSGPGKTKELLFANLQTIRILESMGLKVWALLDSRYRATRELLTLEDAALCWEAGQTVRGVWIWTGYADWLMTYGNLN